MPMDPFENPSNFSEDVGMFEAATHAAPLQLPMPELRHIALAPDGMNQDATVSGYGEALAARTGATLRTLPFATRAADLLVALTAQPTDLLILPVPYGQDYAELASDSLGAVADLLLMKSPCPVLCVRAPQDSDSIQASLNHAVVPIAVADDLVSRALGWAFLLTSAGGQVDLVAVADRDVFSEARHLLPENADPNLLQPEELSRAQLRDIGSLVSASQRHGSGHDRAVHVETRVGPFVPLVLGQLHGQPRLIVWGFKHDHTAPSFHRAVDLLLSSSGPVLMV